MPSTVNANQPAHVAAVAEELGPGQEPGAQAAAGVKRADIVALRVSRARQEQAEERGWDAYTTVHFVDRTPWTFYPAGVGVSKHSVLLVLTALLASSALADTPPASPPKESPPKEDPVQAHRKRVAIAKHQMLEGDKRLAADDPRAACRAYEAAIEVLPTWWMPRLAFVNCGRYVGAPTAVLLEHARFAVRARPGLALAHARLGFVLEDAGKIAEARRAYESALRVRAGMFDVRYRLGVMLARQGKSRAARRHLEQVLKSRPDHVVALRYLAGMYEKLGRLAQAEAAYRELEVRSRYPALALARLIRFYQRHRMKAQAAEARDRYLARFTPPAP